MVEKEIFLNSSNSFVACQTSCYLVVFLLIKILLDSVAYDCNLSIGETETGGFP